uniref:DDHD domain containing 2 n=1 Tax=Salmo trutta TaxID=8032 RepID=A0A673X2X8_SALTR
NVSCNSISDELLYSLPAPWLSVKSVKLSAMEGVTGVYEPVQHHWFHCQNPVDCRSSWIPFSREDSLRLEETHKHGETSGQGEVEVVVATEGRRFDVRLKERRCFAVYWEQPPLEVRRCSWFHKGDKDISYTPYPEDTSLVLDEAYMMAVKLNDWKKKKIDFPTGETVVLHSPTLMTQQQTIPLKDWISLPSEQSQPRTVKRGLEGIRVELPEGEPDQVDHLVFMVHGIGPTCDIQLRGVIQCVNDFRGASLSLLSSHFKQSQDRTRMGRVEFLPVDWHRVLHGDATGVDDDIQRITLPSISCLRQFSNSTVLDLFFYNSPTYCQTIIDTVASEINRLHQVFLQRHPQFTGAVSLAGHSLETFFKDLGIPLGPRKKIMYLLKRWRGKMLNLHMAHTELLLTPSFPSQVSIVYPQLAFQPQAFFALGSPIGMFLTVRGLKRIDPKYSLPTCKSFYNIFHPFDPVACRIEPMVVFPEGRKRMHLELKDSLKRVSSDLLLFISTVRGVWQTLTMLPVNTLPLVAGVGTTAALPPQESEGSGAPNGTVSPTEMRNISVGMLNGGRRFDYVFQEKPLESFDEYLFAIQSHLCYWDSEDTVKHATVCITFV